MTTIKLTIEYDGSRYPGFSTKKKSTSIESKLTLAIRDVTGQSTQLFAAVKTEPGVHATHQIVSFQLEKESFSDNTELLKMKLNAALPADIAVTSLKIADERFVASLAVKSCTYTCRIATDPAAALFSRPYTCVVTESLDLESMQQAAQLLTGTHDFAAFSNGRTRKSTVRTVLFLVRPFENAAKSCVPVRSCAACCMDSRSRDSVTTQVYGRENNAAAGSVAIRQV